MMGSPHQRITPEEGCAKEHARDEKGKMRRPEVAPPARPGNGSSAIHSRREEPLVNFRRGFRPRGYGHLQSNTLPQAEDHRCAAAPSSRKDPPKRGWRRTSALPSKVPIG